MALHQSKKSSNVARATGALAGVLAEIPEREGDNGTGLMPLPFLLGVLNDAKAPAAIRVKVASSTLPYTHPRQSTRSAKLSVVTDRFGFTVEPALALANTQANAQAGAMPSPEHNFSASPRLSVATRTRYQKPLVPTFDWMTSGYGEVPAPNVQTAKRWANHERSVSRFDR